MTAAEIEITEFRSRSKTRLIVFAGVFLLLTVLIIFIIGQINQTQAPTVTDPQLSATSSPLNPDFDFGISERSFAMGTAGFVPPSYPNHDVQDVKDYWEHVADCCELYGVHLDWKDTAFLANADANSDLNFVLVLGFQTPDEWKHSREAYLTKAKELLTTYPQIQYLAIGNEMNIEYEKDPAAFADFISAYSYLSAELHEYRPGLQISTVLQYEALLGEGYLTGQSELRESELSLLEQLNPASDFLALTSYPFLDFATPAEVPEDYYSRLQAYTDLPIALTETGWISQTEMPLEYKELENTGFNGSEVEQQEWLLRLPRLLSTTETEFVSWAFIFDIKDWQTSVEGSFSLFDSLGLHYNSSEHKASWATWFALKQLPRR